MNQQRYHIYRCKNCDAYYYTGWNNCGTCGAPLFSPVDIDSWPQIYIAPISSQTKSIVGLTPASPGMVVVPTITTDGEVAFLQGGHRSEFESIRENIRSAIARCNYAVSSYTGIFFSYVYYDHDGDLSMLAFCETLLFPEKIAQFDQWYNIFSKLKSTNDDYWNSIMTVLSDDKAKSWINSMLLNIKTNMNWIEYIQSHLQRAGVDIRNSGTGEVFVADNISVI